MNEKLGLKKRFAGLAGWALLLGASAVIWALARQNLQLKTFVSLVADGGYHFFQREAVSADGAPALGPENAMATIVEFSDPICRECLDLMNKVRAKRPGKTRWVYKARLDADQLGRQAITAALAAHVQGRFWEMRAALVQEGEAPSGQQVRDIVRKLGMDWERFQADNDPDVWSDYLAEDARQARALAVRRSPTYFVNGVRLYRHDLKTIDKLIRAFELAPRTIGSP